MWTRKFLSCGPWWKNSEKHIPRNQRWNPQGRLWPWERPGGHILKSLALASQVKSLVSKHQVLKNCPVLGSRTALFLNLWNFHIHMHLLFRLIDNIVKTSHNRPNNQATKHRTNPEVFWSRCSLTKFVQTSRRYKTARKYGNTESRK